MLLSPYSNSFCGEQPNRFKRKNGKERTQKLTISLKGKRKGENIIDLDENLGTELSVCVCRDPEHILSHTSDKPSTFYARLSVHRYPHSSFPTYCSPELSVPEVVLELGHIRMRGSHDTHILLFSAPCVSESLELSIMCAASESHFSCVISDGRNSGSSKVNLSTLEKV